MIGSDRRFNSEMTSTNQKVFFSSNQVIQHVDNNGDHTYFLPCYVRFLLKEIQKVDAGQMEGTVTGTLLFSFYYGSIDRSIIEEFVGEGKGKAILLQFNQHEPILLKQGKGITMKQDQKEKIINFIVRQSFRTNIKGNVFLTPFQTLDLYISVTVQSVHLPRIQRDHKINIKFNCMDSTEVDVLAHGEELSFGYYRIASYYMQAKYSNSRKNPFKPISYFQNHYDDEDDVKSTTSDHGQAKDEEDIRTYQYAHFRIPVYKYPAVSILTIFIPLWILGLVGLFIFFQEPGLGGRLATIAVLALAFVAFLPTINESIPQSPEVKLVDILILMHLAAIILLTVQSYDIRNESAETFEMIWSDSKIFIASLILNAFTFFSVFVLFIMHKCFWERKYTKVQINLNRKYKKLVRKSWRNRECDLAFSHLVASSKFKNL